MSRRSSRWWRDHRDYEAECLAWWWEFVRNPATTSLAMNAILSALFGGPKSAPLCAITPSRYVVPPRGLGITCPRCHRTSYNENDIREGYCGNCHAWTSAPGA